MVSIFAEDVYEETINYDFANATGIGRIDDVPLNFPTIDVSSIVGGFAYIESFTVEASFTGNMDVSNQRPNGGSDPVGIEVKPTYIFNNKLDIFGTVAAGQIEWFSGINSQNLQGPQSGTASFALDSYVDVPSEIGIDAELFSGVHAANTPSTGTITVKVSLVGRKP